MRLCTQKTTLPGRVNMDLQERDRRVKAANEVLASFANGTEIYWQPKIGWCVRWIASRGVPVRRRYTTPKNSNYPPWHRTWGHGGTATAALHALILWCRNDPKTPPLKQWHHRAKPSIALITEREINILRQADYPE